MNPFRPSGRCSARAIALILSASCLATLSWIHHTFIPFHSPEHYLDLIAMSITPPHTHTHTPRPQKKYPDTLGFAVTPTAARFCLCVLVLFFFFFIGAQLVIPNWESGSLSLCGRPRGTGDLSRVLPSLLPDASAGVAAPAPINPG